MPVGLDATSVDAAEDASVDSAVPDATAVDSGARDAMVVDTGPADTGGPDTGVGTMAACGITALPEANDCDGLTDCGDGRNNKVDVTFCEHCFSRAATHVCESGRCRAVANDGTIEVRFIVPESGRGARGFTQASIDPKMADGTTLTCAALLSTCNYLDNGAINATVSNFKTFTTTGGEADPGYRYTTFLGADVGAARLVVIRVTAQQQGRGALRAQGCVEGIDVQDADTTVIAMDLASP